ncbi:MAG: YceI family protein [Bacteroidota bacterium]
MASRQSMRLVLSGTFCALLFVAPFAFGQSGGREYQVRQEDSNVGFSVYKWLVVKEEGRFRDFSGTVYYNPEDLTATKVDFTIRTASIDSRNEGRDSALRSDDYFDVRRHATMTFRSVGSRPAENNMMMLEGNITIKGRTKRITIPVKVLGVHFANQSVGHIAGFESTFTVNRFDFNVGPSGTTMVGSEVTIHLLIGANSPAITARQ